MFNCVVRSAVLLHQLSLVKKSNSEVRSQPRGLTLLEQKTQMNRRNHTLFLHDTIPAQLLLLPATIDCAQLQEWKVRRESGANMWFMMTHKIEQNVHLLHSLHEVSKLNSFFWNHEVHCK